MHIDTETLTSTIVIMIPVLPFPVGFFFLPHPGHVMNSETESLAVTASCPISTLF